MPKILYFLPLRVSFVDNSPAIACARLSIFFAVSPSTQDYGYHKTWACFRCNRCCRRRCDRHRSRSSSFSRTSLFSESPKELVDEVWQIIDQQYVDGTFNQVDWKKVRQEYLSKTYSNKEEAYKSIREMLKKLGILTHASWIHRNFAICKLIPLVN